MEQFDFEKCTWEFHLDNNTAGTMIGMPMSGHMTALQASTNSMAIYRLLKNKNLLPEDDELPISSDYTSDRGKYNLAIKNITLPQWNILSGNTPYVQGALPRKQSVGFSPR